MNSAITRSVLLVAPVIETLQEQLAAEFPLLRLYEQDDPIAFLREQGKNVAAVVTRYRWTIAWSRRTMAGASTT